MAIKKFAQKLFGFLSQGLKLTFSSYMHMCWDLAWIVFILVDPGPGSVVTTFIYAPKCYTCTVNKEQTSAIT